MQRLLDDAHHTNNPRRLDAIYHEMIEVGKQIRSDLGVPYDSSIHRLACLCTEEQQVRRAKCTKRRYGEEIVSRVDGAGELEPSLFAQCFVYKQTSEAFHIIVSEYAKEHINGTIVILPPLLARSNKKEAISYKDVGRGIAKTTRDASPDVTILFFKEGPIIPVIAYDKRYELERFIKKIYKLTGKQTATQADRFLWQ